MISTIDTCEKLDVARICGWSKYEQLAFVNTPR